MQGFACEKEEEKKEDGEGMCEGRKVHIMSGI